MAPESTDFDTLANDTGGTWIDIYDSDFRVVLDNLQTSLTSRYAVTYKSPRPGDGTGRRVDLYVNDSDVGVANDTDAYVAPDGVQGDCTGPDSDGDGISDYCETTGIPLANGPTVTTDPMDKDTDGDGLEDGTELDYLSSKVTTTDGEFVGYNWISNSKKTHTDDDSLSDKTEYEGWSLNVTTTSGGEPYKWAPAADGDDTVSTITVTSDPKTKHSDGDRLSDGVERTETHTDPREEVTYQITENHEQYLTELDSNAASVVMPPTQSVSVIRKIGLTDRTDDFDFITLDDTEPTILDQLTFESISGSERSDVWFSNRRERMYGTDPWDPDTDGDGLTDGWEVDGTTIYIDLPQSLSEGYYFAQSQPYGGTDPTNPDSDDDGYWDGWIGVYGTNYTDDVILYRENLEDGQEDSEVVREQTELHEVPEDHDPGVDIDDDGHKEHSKVHIGERQWGTDPSGGSTPSLGFGIEADFVEGTPNARLNNDNWETAIERNFELYGLVVDIERDATIERDGGLPLDSLAEAISESNDENEDLYMFLSTRREPAGDGMWGFNNDATVEVEPYDQSLIPANGMILYASEISSSAGTLATESDVDGSPYRSKTGLVSGLVGMHEIGHSFDIGEADDSDIIPLPKGEVYSGRPNDDTKEYYYPNSPTQWSIMRSGWDQNSIFVYNDSSYYTYSIEELSTIDEP